MDRQTQEQVMADQEKARQETQARREKEHTEKLIRERKAMDTLEARIAPLTLSPVKQWRDDDPEHTGVEWWGYMNRSILSESGEQVGHIRYASTGYSWKSVMTWSLTSPRIPARRAYGQASRHYKKFESVVAGVKKFCIAVSADEDRAKVLRKELRHYRDTLQRAFIRSLHISGDGYSSPNVDGFIKLLASDIKQDQIEGAEFIRILVRKKRVHTRFNKWVNETFITPRQTELDSLDLSKETVA